MYREASIFYFSAPFFWCSLFFKNISTPLSFKISLRDTSFHISLNSLGFYLFRMLVEFSLACIFSFMYGIYGVSISRKCIQSIYFYSCSSPLYKIIFWNSVSPKTSMICFIKIQSENMNMTWNISLFIFCMICNFSKCDGFSVL